MAWRPWPDEQPRRTQPHDQDKGQSIVRRFIIEHQLLITIIFAVVVAILQIIYITGCMSYSNITYRIDTVVETRKDAPEFCSALTHVNARACAKFNVFEYRPKQCRIIITPDDAHNRMDILGHELLHCMIGRWHE